MGGDYYERDVYVNNNNVNVGGGGYSIESEQINNNTKMNPGLNPTRWNDEKITNTSSNPIVFAFDVTGSMGDWIKVIYDKLPMFYGQIKIQEYLKDPSVSFCAIGDHNCCTAPLQVSEFGQGIELDQMISKLYIEKNGGGNEHESYEMAAYFYLNRVDLGKCEYPFFFVTGDEGYFETIEPEILKKFLDLEETDYINSYELWKKLMAKYNVFHIKKPYLSKNYEEKIRNQWEMTLSEERVIMLSEPKAIVDVILGLIALTSESRTLEEYLKDMEQRGQSGERIDLVKRTLSNYYSKLKMKKINVIKTLDENNNQNEVKNDNKNIDCREVVLNSLSDDDKKLYKDYSKLSDLMMDSIPKELLCPLTNTLLMYPVFNPKIKNFNFEKSVIDFINKDKALSKQFESMKLNEVTNENQDLRKSALNFYLQNEKQLNK